LADLVLEWEAGAGKASGIGHLGGDEPAAPHPPVSI
jgi:hypothetical protein